MKFVEITGKKFRLGSRFTRLFAFLIDGMLLASILLGFVPSSRCCESRSSVQIGLLSALLWILGPKTKLPRNVLVVAQLLLVFLFGPWGHNNPETLAMSGLRRCGQQACFSWMASKMGRDLARNCCPYRC